MPITLLHDLEAMICTQGVEGCPQHSSRIHAEAERAPQLHKIT